MHSVLHRKTNWMRAIDPSFMLFRQRQSSTLVPALKPSRNCTTPQHPHARSARIRVRETATCRAAAAPRCLPLHKRFFSSSAFLLHDTSTTFGASYFVLWSAFCKFLFENTPRCTCDATPHTPSASRRLSRRSCTCVNNVACFRSSRVSWLV
jgi:hypothetical protein